MELVTAGIIAAAAWYNTDKVSTLKYNKRFLTSTELDGVINLVKVRYPRVAHISNKTMKGICFTESGKIEGGVKKVDNFALRQGHGIDKSLGICQLIKPTAEGMKRRHPDLPAIKNYDASIGCYLEFKDPFVSLSYGMNLINDNYKVYKSMSKAVKAYNAGGAINSIAALAYLEKVINNTKIFGA